MKACDCCRGTGWIIEARDGFRNGRQCDRCLGRGTEPETPDEIEARRRIIRTELLTSFAQPAPKRDRETTL